MNRSVAQLLVLPVRQTTNRTVFVVECSFRFCFVSKAVAGHKLSVWKLGTVRAQIVTVLIVLAKPADLGVRHQ